MLQARRKLHHCASHLLAQIAKLVVTIANKHDLKYSNYNKNLILSTFHRNNCPLKYLSSLYERKLVRVVYGLDLNMLGVTILQCSLKLYNIDLPNFHY